LLIVSGYFRLGEVFFETNDFANAGVAYKTALSLKPGDVVIKRRLTCATEASGSRFYFRQLLPGRDIALPQSAVGDPVKRQIFAAATQMKNFIYVVGDYITKECFVIDACWDVDGILAVIHNDKMKLTGAIATHCTCFWLSQTQTLRTAPFVTIYCFARLTFFVTTITQTTSTTSGGNRRRRLTRSVSLFPV
jgi:hypothetical protein|tara:strand:+ start:2722 stop:3297 length:576 start_codon:yes stop_codon:yes gene_type:complete